MRPLVRYLRSLNPNLPRVVWTLQAGGLASAFGIGVVLPFTIIYLHNVRGISLTIAGLAAAVSALAAIPSGALAGAFADRVGPKRTLVASLLVQAAAIACFPLIREGWHALALQFLLGCGSGAFWPSQSSLLTHLTPNDRLHAAFAQQRVTLNFGIGLGGLAGGAIAVVSEPVTFTLLFTIDALTFLAFAAILIRVPSPMPMQHDGAPGSYVDVLRNRPFRSFLLLNTMVIAAGIVPFVEFMPVYARNRAGVSEQAIGFIFFANTLTIVLLQLPVAKALEGTRRMPAFALMGAIWAAMWLVVPAAVERLDATAAAVVLGVAAAIFGVGECLHGTVQGPLVADLADARLLGRYMALSSLSWQVAFVLGPAIGGVVLDLEPVALWLLAAVICAIGAVWSLALERAIPESLRRTPGSAETVALETLPSAATHMQPPTGEVPSAPR